jgi:hypothetical protein
MDNVERGPRDQKSFQEPIQMIRNFPFKPFCLLLLTAIATSANAAVTMLGGSTNGDFTDIRYGPGGLGTVFQLNALLYVDEVSSTAQIVEQLTTFTKLKVDTTAFGPVGLGTGLAEFDYRVTNVDTNPQSNLRFMTVFGIDGNPTTLFESVAETWGAKLASDPSRRETLAWDGVPGPSSLNNLWISSNGAASPEGSGVPPACVAASVCDTFVGLQWDVPVLNPGESFLVRVGLSDDGQHLSSRFLTVTADPTGGISNALTVSGSIEITPVPEPSSLGLLVAGLIAVTLIGIARHRRRLSDARSNLVGLGARRRA